ncbi:Hsp20/alpha crystallin family protein [Candidatus Micrarchaeota archaeon]|nr:Hsp20/alpha crystallin family protein [Candidatus Micrarchaeota archaeon]
MGLPTKYDPFDEMRRMQKEMDEMFASFFERGGERSIIEWGPRIPLADVEDNGDSIKVTAELPGLDKDDIKISISKDSAEISAERKDIKEDKKRDYYHCERSYSSYKRVFRLPHDIDPDAVDAEYSNGILKIEMKKAYRNEEKKKIQIR